MQWIVSAVPGRIRIRAVQLRDAARQERLGAVLAEIDGIVDVEGNPRTGSMLLRYTPERATRVEMEARVSAAVGAELAPPAAPRAEDHAPRTPRRWQRDRRLNTWAKYGMLGSLGVSLALAAAGNKKAHAATGGLFLGLLGVHLAVHRRHLFK
ncbi:HMA2 domain-containing protein [Azoarcus sp. DN11]|uniref:HMA2 domain-containing protein n=1 Tax=Azoarcus sp. DN11 TaxID=356837 RepID=UPI000EB41D10|nr:hypothetical protein [Azoarcus sp. DN11]AYH42212.1 hypothetical protein CDA09_02225 [Azoarcus sp. DN11]